MLGRLYCLLVLAVLAQSRSSSLTGTCAWETSVSHSANRIPTSITEVYCARVGVPCGRGAFCKVCIVGVSQQLLNRNVFKVNLKIGNFRILTFFAKKIRQFELKEGLHICYLECKQTFTNFSSLVILRFSPPKKSSN